MDLGLSGKVAIVTGSSRGLGLASARSLASEGAHLVCCARGAEGLAKAAADLRSSTSAEVITVCCDISTPDGASKLVDAARSKWGRVDVLVNNVGGNRRGRFEEIGDQDWIDIFELNVLSALRVSRLAIPLMREGGGSIVFVSSVFGREKGGPGLVAYNTTKSAMISAAGIMALEYASEGIRVNSVAPGSIRFEGGSWDRRVKADPEGMKEFVKANLPLGRFGRDHEVGDLVAFLASERAGLITGACIAVDGAQGRALI